MLAAGCGGSEDDGLTKAEFVKKANAICKAATKKALVKVGRVTGSGQAASEDNIEIMLAPYREEVDGIGALDVPSGDEDEVAAIVEPIEKAVVVVEKDVKNLEQANILLAKSGDLADKYGMEACPIE
jgi:hypothetical protein